MSYSLAHLWQHQRQAVEAVMAAIAAGNKAGLVVLPTGTGKTTLFLSIARILGVPTLVLVHRDFLVSQTVEEAKALWPEAAIGVIQAERDEWQTDLFGHVPDLVVGSVQSLHSARLAMIPRDRFGLLISDEAHRSVTRTWSRVIEHFARCGFHLGATATPDRLDRIGLAKHFGRDPLFIYTIRQAIDDQVLVPPRQYAIVTGISLDAVRENTRGQWDEAELSRTVSVTPRNQEIVKKYLEIAKDRRAIVFAVDVDHVNALVREFEEAGVAAVAVTGQDKKGRSGKLADFKAGKYRVMVNCEVAVEGFNDKGVSCIIMARPTKSRLFYLQAIGRGLRRCPEENKVDCLVIDAVDVSRMHKLVTLCNLLGLSKTQDAGGRKVLELADEEEEGRRQEHERQRQQVLTFPVQWRLEEVSPWPDMPSLSGYAPQKRWHTEPATEKQVRALHRMGLAVQRELTRGEASWLFDRAREYDFVFPTPATPAQERFLRRAGEWEEALCKREASRRIARLKAPVEGGHG